MILADTSAWVEYLRATGSDADTRLSRALAQDEPVRTTEVVVMELLAGTRTEAEWQSVGRMLARHPLIEVQSIADWEHAAALYQRCRRAGETVRKMTDCLIAAVAVREGASVLHRDSDFDILARHTPLRVEAG